MTEAQIKAQEAKDFKDRQAKRARAKVPDKGVSHVRHCADHGVLRTRARKRMMKIGPNVYATFPPPPPPHFHQAKQNASAATNQQQPGGDASAHGQSTASLPGAKADHQSGDTGVAGDCAGAGDDGVDAGIDLSQKAYSAGADESGARVLCAWLNANVTTTFIEVRRRRSRDRLTEQLGFRGFRVGHNFTRSRECFFRHAHGISATPRVPVSANRLDHTRPHTHTYLLLTRFYRTLQEFPRSICEAHGRPALEAIETMSGKRVPGQVWRKLGPSPGGGKSSGGGSGMGKADERVSALMEQYRQMLRFLGEKGCLLNTVRPEVRLLHLAFPALLDQTTQYTPSWTVPMKPGEKAPMHPH